MKQTRQAVRVIKQSIYYLDVYADNLSILHGFHRHLSNIDGLSIVMCPLLAPVIIGFFAADFNNTNEANKAGGTRH
jgi:hypothetical protein